MERTFTLLRGLVSKARALALRRQNPFPEFEVRVPQEQQSKRFDTFTDAEWKQLKSALDPFLEPEEQVNHPKNLLPFQHPNAAPQDRGKQEPKNLRREMHCHRAGHLPALP